MAGWFQHGLPMTSSVLVWPVQALHRTLALEWPDASVAAVAEIDSTNTELMRRARAGATRPTLLIAEAQSAGRGRRDHRWIAEPTAALLFSLGVPLAPANWAGLSLAVGLAVARSLHADIGIKWPNDLWLQGRKMAGILIETAGLPDGEAGRYAVIGVGINLAEPPPGAYATPPAWLRELLPHAEAPLVLEQVLPALLQALRTFERAGFEAFHDAYARRDALAGRAVRLSDGRHGTARGVAADGALRVETGDGMVLEHGGAVAVGTSQSAAERGS